MRILTVVGNRPQFVKAAVVSQPLRRVHEEILVHTGQHHDENLSEVFFDELGLMAPQHQLAISGGSNTSQTARMLSGLEALIADVSPDAALVYGDTNSTLAGALAAAQARVPVIHVEAGMRSFEKAMPEELNRVLTDHLAELLLCSSQTAAGNLARESVSGQVEVVGDVMVDLALRYRNRSDACLIAPERDGLHPGGYVLVSAHRAGNVDIPERLAALVDLLASLPLPVVFPIHPRTRERLRQTGLIGRLAAMEQVRMTEPLGYREFAALLHSAKAVLTDSGGVQKEAYIAGVPCITMRATTEWVETVEAGWNTLIDLDLDAALAALRTAPPSQRPPLYGEGDAAARCVEAITSWAQRRGFASAQ